jgi:hypothetical protein
LQLLISRQKGNNVEKGHGITHAFINEIRGKPMKFKTAARVLVLSMLTSMGTAYAAGGPMNQDLTPLVTFAQKALEASKQGDAATFVKESEGALALAKEQPASAATQRVIGKLKTAVNLGKTGNLTDGAKALEEAMGDMTKGAPPKFGGGN